MPEVFELVISPSGEWDSGWVDEDSIEFGLPPREWAVQMPNWLDPLLHRVPTKLLLAALIVGLAVAAGLSATRPSPTKAAPAPFVTPVTVQSPAQLALQTMVGLAESPTALANFVINDNVHPSCPAATTQPNPAAAIATAVTRYQPSYHLVDSGLGSEITGVCSAQLRFAGELGNTMVVTVIAPPNPVIPFIVSSANDRTDALDLLVTVNSWRIEIGMIGQPGTLLDERDLVAIATDARLRWA